MTSRIFRSVCVASLCVLLASVVLIMGVLYNYFTQVQMDQLRTETALTAHAVANQGMDYFVGLSATSGFRITWISSDGTVLYDSSSNSGDMQNHLAREEVREAFLQGSGESIRYSDTLLRRSLYAARLLPDGTVLRLSLSQSSIWNLLLGMLQPICVIIAIAVVLSLVLASRLSRSITQPLNRLDLDDPLSNTQYEEIQPLLHRLESQQCQLRQQKRELALRQKEFSTVTRSLSEGLVLLNSSGTILSINAAAARLLAVTQNCTGADFGVACENPAITQLAEQALSGNKTEATLPLAEGSFLITARPVRTDGALSGAALLMLDVTQKQRTEQLRREFTANVSHELKTPLHTISGYAELMKNGLVPREDVPQCAEKIFQEAQRLGKLVEDILRLSRLDEGAADMPWEETDLYALAKDAVAALSTTAELAQVRLTLEGKPSVIRGIPQLLQGIVLNLLSNAVKYNRPGGSAAIRVEELPETVRLTVSDTGIGIPEAEQERVFERFYRVDKSHSRQVGGTGLGLSIVKHSALIHNARLSLSSTPDKGTVVSVEFPK